MAQMDDEIGAVLQHLKDIGVERENTIVGFSDRQRRRGCLTWPDGGMDAVRRLAREWGLEGGSVHPAITVGPGHVPAGKVWRTGIGSNDWFPDAGRRWPATRPSRPTLLKGKQDRRPVPIQVYLDGVRPDSVYITGKGPSVGAHVVLLLPPGRSLQRCATDDWQ